MIPLAEDHNTSFFSAQNYTQVVSQLLRSHEQLAVSLAVHHRRATEAYKSSMVPHFTIEVYLTSLTTGQSFRKQGCGLKQNSLQWGYLPPGKIWSRSLLVNVIQCSPPTLKTMHEYILMTDLLGSSLLFPQVNWKLFCFCFPVTKP